MTAKSDEDMVSTIKALPRTRRVRVTIELPGDFSSGLELFRIAAQWWRERSEREVTQ